MLWTKLYGFISIPELPMIFMLDTKTMRSIGSSIPPVGKPRETSQIDAASFLPNAFGH